MKKNKTYQKEVALIIEASKKYISNNQNLLNKKDGITFLEVDTLVSKNYIDSSVIINPYNNKTMDGCITISFNGTDYVYLYNDITCLILKATYQPKFEYENQITEVEVGTVYTFPTKVNVTSKNSKQLTASKPVIKKDGNTVDKLDTSIVGDEYEIFYSAYDSDFDMTYTDSYKVKVVDKTGPKIVIKHPDNINANTSDYSKNHEVYIVEGNTYNLPDAIVTDNSCGINGTDTKVNNCNNTLNYNKNGSVDTSKPGYYKITYSATDSSNNKTELVLTVIITPVEFNCDNAECTYTIPVAGTYKIEGYGAQGGNNGGLGGYISASVKLNIGDILKLRVGTTSGNNGGGTAGGAGASGGGATTIIKNGVTILTAAGGGATGSTAGGPGGVGTGLGALKQTNCGSSAGDGMNGGGGGSTGSCTYEAEDNYTCVKVCTMNQCDKNNANCQTIYYDCTSQCSGKIIKTSYGAGGEGGASSLGTNIIQIDRKDGNHSGNGKATVSYLSE